ncbi:hypothetical protein A2Z33_02555 [Candidatus Gottesmanbacteria bacterium RBG_16_52_11]|uniref:Uncharacterized protein n=1 Tax=Candidatus Gottesmanbacteria bacterium RBG_16_52_11 TaxID=1798374 RepID=A0A1F5YMH1_9BACT|nr:MAG: hypothetical protein A2Z33_02555 [Candidatus Gottesmanbacteria bacterium RBG_16_52_11]
MFVLIVAAVAAKSYDSTFDFRSKAATETVFRDGGFKRRQNDPETSKYNYTLKIDSRNRISYSHEVF